MQFTDLMSVTFTFAGAFAASILKSYLTRSYWLSIPSHRDTQRTHHCGRIKCPRVGTNAWVAGMVQTPIGRKFSEAPGLRCGGNIRFEVTIMNDWLHNLPIVWMALLVFGLTALSATAIYVVVMALSVGERARSFKAVSPGLLSPLGILFALFFRIHRDASLERQRQGQFSR
jgi:hypothetical protein